jgi:predicted O-methyltransferase YrrM
VGQILRTDCSLEEVAILSNLVAETESLAGVIVECGSYQGGTAMSMARVTRRPIYCFDVFGGYPYGKGTDFDRFSDADFEEVIRAVSHYPNIQLIRGRHEDMVPGFQRRISLLFMDSDFYSSHKVCLTHFWPQIPSGGVAVFHDWDFREVQQAIKECIPFSERQSETDGIPPYKKMGYIRKA